MWSTNHEVGKEQIYELQSRERAMANTLCVNGLSKYRQFGRVAIYKGTRGFD